jgi:hypothetical protein
MGGIKISLTMEILKSGMTRWQIEEKYFSMPTVINAL